MKAIEAVFKLSEMLDLPPSIVFEAAREVESIEKNMQQEINARRTAPGRSHAARVSLNWAYHPSRR